MPMGQDILKGSAEKQFSQIKDKIYVYVLYF